MQTVTLTIQSTRNNRTEDRGVIRIRQIGNIEWVVEFCYDNGQNGVQLLRRSFLVPREGNIMYLVLMAMSQLDTYHFEGDIDASVSPDLARRLGSGDSEV